METALYGKIKERKKTREEWLIGANTQNIPYLSIAVTTQDKKQVRKLPTDEN